jgi:hypothetical protein
MARPRRRVAVRPNRRELLVFVEGEVTEEEYLKHWHRRFRQKVNVEIHEFHGSPNALVERAAEEKAKNEKEARRGRGRAHDEVWCVFDVDDHPLLEEATELAGREGINLAVSNPCIELWFLLHFTDQTAYIERHAAQRATRTYLACGKSLTDQALALLEDGFDVARARAQRLEQEHRGDGTPAPGNPGSGLWRLIDSISA